MDSTNPFRDAGIRAEKQAVARHRRTKNRERSIASAQGYLETSQRFELKVGEQRTGEARTMLGREAKALNDALRTAWVAVIMENPDSELRLNRWCQPETP